jgi:hypothetical protein
VGQRLDENAIAGAAAMIDMAIIAAFSSISVTRTPCAGCFERITQGPQRHTDQHQILEEKLRARLVAASGVSLTFHFGPLPDAGCLALRTEPR